MNNQKDYSDQPPPFGQVAIIGLGLLGGSVGLAVRDALPGCTVTGYDADATVRERAGKLGLAHKICDTPQEAVANADLVLFCIPLGRMTEAALDVRDGLSPNVLVSDVGSSKQTVTRDLQTALPGIDIIPAHPVAGTENSGPDAAFASLFRHRWCILTPPPQTDPAKLDALTRFWQALGATVEVMDALHHDNVLAVTSHIPHLIAYTIVGTASDLEDVTRSEVIKYSAGGFRDFTRIAASNPVMWRDVFLNNRESVLEMLDQFMADLGAMRTAIDEGDGESLYDLFKRTREIRRRIIAMGQDDARPDFGRSDH